MIIFVSISGQANVIILALTKYLTGWIVGRFYRVGEKKRYFLINPPDYEEVQKKCEQIQNYAAYVEEGLRQDLKSPFDDIVEPSIIGSDRFVDWIKREYLLRRSSDRGEEPALVHLPKSFSIDHVRNNSLPSLHKILKRAEGAIAKT
jgi:hypothetical protein